MAAVAVCPLVGRVLLPVRAPSLPTAPQQSCSPCQPGPRLWEGLDGRGQSWESAQLPAPGGNEVLCLGGTSPVLLPDAGGGVSLWALSCSHWAGARERPLPPQLRPGASGSAPPGAPTRPVLCKQTNVCAAMLVEVNVCVRACEQTARVAGAVGRPPAGPSPTSVPTALVPGSSSVLDFPFLSGKDTRSPQPRGRTPATRGRPSVARGDPAHARAFPRPVLDHRKRGGVPAWVGAGRSCRARPRAAPAGALLRAPRPRRPLAADLGALCWCFFLFTCQDRYDCGPPTPFNSPAQEVPHQRTHGPSERVTPVLT